MAVFMLEVALAILNAKVFTLDPEQPNASAIAVRNGRIVALGTDEEVKKHIGNKTKIVDAKHKTVVPGFVDCHVHMMGFGSFLHELNLREVQSINELQIRLREYAGRHRKAKWIRGGRWDQERLAEKRLPTRWDLDSVIADKPVFLIRVCGHMAVVNSKVMHVAGINRKTSVEGGRVDLDPKSGEPNGVIRENVLDLVFKAIPKSSLQEFEETCLLASRKAVESGLTCVHWMVDSMDEIHALREIDSAGRLPLRVYLGVSIRLLDELKQLQLLEDHEDSMVKIGFVKILADGSLGAHTAALKSPYSDDPRTCGMLLYSQRNLENLVLKAHKAGFQLAVHAIGDQAIEAVLKTYEKALKAFPKVDHRHRIEHCSVLNPKLIDWMKRLGVIVSVQPHFVVSDSWTVDRVGKKRSRWIYPFKTLIRKGLVVVSGSDCPVEKIDPLLGIWAAVTQNRPAERLTVDEALRTYTINAAQASFDENEKGTIQVGKLADFTVLSDNLFDLEPDKLKAVTVEMTIVDGKVVYARRGFQWSA
jgi:predicted amidohydrolase YtcJ